MPLGGAASLSFLGRAIISRSSASVHRATHMTLPAMLLLLFSPLMPVMMMMMMKAKHGFDDAAQYANHMTRSFYI
jgi:hypothetical protein